MSNALLGIYVKTLGCKVNQVESETLMRSLAGLNVCLVDNPEDAAIIVVNTCSVTHEADAKTRKALRKLAKIPGVLLVVATGCSAALHEKEIEELHPHIKVMADKTKLAPTIQELFHLENTHEVTRGDLRKEYPRLFRSRSFIKIQDGCDNFCSYCIVPYARNVLRSEPAQAILKEVEELARNGVKEVVLTGINVGRYVDKSAGIDSLTQLVEQLSQTAIERIRISSIEPVHIDEAFCALLNANSKVCEHLHIPLQSGSNVILRAMNRHYTREEYLHIIENLKKAAPLIALSTDVIVGFPGETDQDFQDTLDLCKACGFSKIHVFRYSKRAGTPAASLPQVDVRCVAERAEKSRSLGAQLAQDYRAQLSGKMLDVLIEKESEGQLYGTSREHIAYTCPVGTLDVHEQTIEVGKIASVIG